jgi:cytochrome c oxidase subunit 2
MNRWQFAKRLLPLFTAMMLLLTACGREDLSALNPQGPIAQQQYDLMKLSFFIMAGVLIVVFAILFYVLIRYRRRPGQDDIPAQVEGNHTLEIVWTAIPILLLIILGFFTIKTVFTQAEDLSNDPNAVKVKVTAHQFWWEFDYPELGIKTAQELVIPTDKKIWVELVSADVVHSFWVPSLAGKIDTNIGVTNKFYFEAPKEGLYMGKCAELCGTSHALMEFKVKAVSPDEFQTWTAKMKEPAELPADPEIKDVLVNQCLTCHAIGDQGSPAYPNLTGIGSRASVAGILNNTEEHTVEENLKRWIADPQEVKPGNMMPKVDLTQEQIDGLAKYLAEQTLD